MRIFIGEFPIKCVSIAKILHEHFYEKVEWFQNHWKSHRVAFQLIYIPISSHVCKSTSNTNITRVRAPRNEAK